ncbi:aldo/keto reductase [Herbiconiux sp. CPCC 205763]|uniref:Aldo/keto reductase n=1 Tax=Herbiconiux aconitum TaxID=2970913 RepID=A0ABT2GTB2_9MICO|nr:aldo/keto reductase [Herbiconiux aconitum]MCS5719376.1 aldo/keto reductase [Herbiconiux aconitum]
MVTPMPRRLFDGLPPVHPIGFGAMQLTGPQVWGPYPDQDKAIALLRSLLDEGVNFIDTADVYGPHTNEELIRDALYPYPDDLIIASKGGFVRGGPDYSSLGWVGNPKYLRQALTGSLRRLRLERMPLYYLHSGYATDAPFADQVGELKAMQEEGLILHIGLSNVTAEQFAEARRIVPIAAVTALYNVGNRSGSALLRASEETGAVFSPWHPVSLSDGGDNVDRVRQTMEAIARAHDASARQIALAWLLSRSQNILPIPGTTDLLHLRDNVAAAAIELSADEIAQISALSPEV